MQFIKLQHNANYHNKIQCQMSITARCHLSGRNTLSSIWLQRISPCQTVTQCDVSAQCPHQITSTKPPIRLQHNVTYEIATQYHLSDYNTISLIRLQYNITYQVTTQYYLSNYNISPTRLQHNTTYQTTTPYHLSDYNTISPIRLQHNITYQITIQYYLSNYNTIWPIRL
jgi:hypothetical protein